MQKNCFVDWLFKFLGYFKLSQSEKSIHHCSFYVSNVKRISFVRIVYLYSGKLLFFKVTFSNLWGFASSSKPLELGGIITFSINSFKNKIILSSIFTRNSWFYTTETGYVFWGIFTWCRVRVSQNLIKMKLSILPVSNIV